MPQGRLHQLLKLALPKSEGEYQAVEINGWSAAAAENSGAIKNANPPGKVAAHLPLGGIRVGTLLCWGHKLGGRQLLALAPLQKPTFFACLGACRCIIP